MWVKSKGIPFWGRCTTHFSTYFSGDWDVPWGYDLDFDPWPLYISSCGLVVEIQPLNC